MNVKPFSSSTRLGVCVALLAAVCVGLTPGVADAATSKNCAKEVVADWYGDGRVDKLFPLHCYPDAIRTLPVDVLDYSNAKEDILRALAYAKKGQKDPGDGGTGKPGTGTGPDETTPTGPDETTPTGPDETSTTDETVAGGTDDDIDTSGPSSVPIPLLVLGGLALLLLAAGGAGYLNRRRSGGAGGPDAGL